MTFSYDYDLWPDLLTAVDGCPIMYDRSGNPALWHDGREFTWERGRQLTHIQPGEASPPDVLEVEFEYDVNGIRTSKTVTHPDGTYTNHTFYTQGGRIVAERREFSDDRVHTLEFFYDEAGRPVQVFFCNGDRFQRVYNYVLNLQGDVIEIRNADNGIVVARYLYNAWGELLESYGWFAEYNPIRYRGYYFCSGSGFYYLQSRYYCPSIGRFINADEFVSTGQGLLGFNMFAYCNNNPVMFIDPDGRRPQGFTDVQRGLEHSRAMRGEGPIPQSRGGTAGQQAGTQNNARAPGPPLAAGSVPHSVSITFSVTSHLHPRIKAGSRAFSFGGVALTFMDSIEKGESLDTAIIRSGWYAGATLLGKYLGAAIGGPPGALASWAFTTFAVSIMKREMPPLPFDILPPPGSPRWGCGYAHGQPWDYYIPYRRCQFPLWYF